MKKFVIFSVCLFFTFIVFGQKETKEVKGNVEAVEVSPPQFTGINNAAVFLKTDNSKCVANYLRENLYCPVAVEGNTEGTEIVQFTVTPSGDLTNFVIVNSVSREIDKEMVRGLKTTKGMWMPGLNNGKATAMEKEITLLFGNCKEGAFVEHFKQKASRFFKHGSSNLLVKNKPKKALRDYKQAARYLPNDKALLLMRGMCYYELGDENNAEKDWNRLVSLGGMDVSTTDYDLVGMKGYAEMSTILAKKK